jgi:hypothetical protein
MASSRPCKKRPIEARSSVRIYQTQNLMTFNPETWAAFPVLCSFTRDTASSDRAERSSHRVSADGAAFMAGDQSVSRPVANRRFQPIDEDRRFAERALMSSPRVRIPMAPRSGQRS